jgi:hypothetical protein
MHTAYSVHTNVILRVFCTKHGPFGHTHAHDVTSHKSKLSAVADLGVRCEWGLTGTSSKIICSWWHPLQIHFNLASDACSIKVVGVGQRFVYKCKMHIPLYGLVSERFETGRTGEQSHKGIQPRQGI